MSVIYIALPLALLLAVAAVMAFIWSVNDGQLDDLQTPSVRMLQDDPKRPSDEIPSEQDIGSRVLEPDVHPVNEENPGNKTL